MCVHVLALPGCCKAGGQPNGLEHIYLMGVVEGCRECVVYGSAPGNKPTAVRAETRGERDMEEARSPLRPCRTRSTETAVKQEGGPSCFPVPEGLVGHREGWEEMTTHMPVDRGKRIHRDAVWAWHPISLKRKHLLSR